MIKLQACGHDSSSIARSDYGTYCSECLPDGSAETYVVENVRAYVEHTGNYVVASLPDALRGKIAVTPFNNRRQATEFAQGLRCEAWVIRPDGQNITWFENKDPERVMARFFGDKRG